MNIIVTIKVKTSDKYYDLSLPDDKMVSEFLDDIYNLLHHYDKAFLPFNKIEKVYSKNKGKYIPLDSTLKKTGIVDGDTIYLE